MRDPRKVAILGGGMAGLAAAWRLSEPGWQSQYSSITVYQRGHRLGGKGASSRGANGRVEEHGLHIWLGYYENAFRLLREVYAELDRERTDPGSPIKTWTDAIFPATDVGLWQHDDSGWGSWLASISRNDMVPGEPDAVTTPFTPIDFLVRGLGLVRDYLASVQRDPPAGSGLRLSSRPSPPPDPQSSRLDRAQITMALAALGAETLAHAQHLLGPMDANRLTADLADSLRALRDALDAEFADRPGHDKVANLFSLVLAVIRGVVADNLATDANGFRKINDQEFMAWVRTHGASDGAVNSPLVRGLYDLVFGYRDGDPARPEFGAGWATFLTSKTFFDFKGAIFWKMAAGMGDVVFAPLYQALVDRGVTFEFFSRVDELRVSDDGHAIESVQIGRQATPRSAYHPLVRVKGLWCFRDHADPAQLHDADGIEQAELERHWCDWPDVEQQTLRRGVDFDEIVLAIPPGMARYVCRDLAERSPRWREMLDGLHTVPTQALQLWLRSDEPTLGWNHPGATTSGHVEPFDTWASMPQLIEVEAWPDDDQPRTIAYFCNALPARWPGEEGWAAFAADAHETVRANARDFVEGPLADLLPGTHDGEGFRWDLLCGAPPSAGAEAIDTQFWTANVDPSDRYVQSIPDTDRFRMRPDDSGFENLFLAGDWTDCGLNAGCIEAAVLSGLQAANAVAGRPRLHRLVGQYLW